MGNKEVEKSAFLHHSAMFSSQSLWKSRSRTGSAGCQGEEEGERIVREFGSNLYTLLCLKWITNKVLLHIAKGTLLKVMWQFRRTRGLEENGYMHMYD